MENKKGKSLLEVITNECCPQCAIKKIIHSYSIVNDLFLLMFLYKNTKIKTKCYIGGILLKYALMFFSKWKYPPKKSKKKKKCD